MTDIEKLKQKGLFRQAIQELERQLAAKEAALVVAYAEIARLRAVIATPGARAEGKQR